MTVKNVIIAMTNPRTGEMAQPIKAPAKKLPDLSWSPRMDMVEEKNKLLQKLYVHTHTKM